MKKEIKLVFIGNRFNGVELVSAFIRDGLSDKEDNHLYFKSGKYVIGSKYRAEENLLDKTLSLFTKGLIVNDKFENEACLKKWRLESKAAIAVKRDQSSRARVDSNPLPNALIEELRSEISCLKHDDAKAFLDYLVHEILFAPMRDEINKKMYERMMNNHIKKLKKVKK